VERTKPALTRGCEQWRVSVIPIVRYRIAETPTLFVSALQNYTAANTTGFALDNRFRSFAGAAFG